MGFGSGGNKFGSGKGDVDGDVTVRGTTPKLTIGDGGEEDTMLVFDGAAQDYRIGIDDGTDTLEIGHGDAHGTRAAIIVNSSGEVTKIGQQTQTSGHFLKFDGSKFLLAAVSGEVAGGVAADDINVGDAAVTLATSAGNITVDARGNNTDIIFKGTDGGSDTTFLTLDGSDAGTAVFNHDIHLDSDASILAFGDNQEITLTHEHNVGLILEGNGVTECPVLTLKNTNNDATGGTLKFLKDGGNVADDDVVGNITFVSEDDGDNAHTYASIVGSIADMTGGAEGGRIELKVAEHDGTVTTGLKLQDGNADGEIDVTVGAGASSVTTIAGTLTMGSTAAMTNAGLLSVGNQSNITGTGALDSGSITSGFGNIDIGSSSLAAGSLDVSDGNITNVGDIALDSISADGNDINVAVTDNRSTAFTIKQGSDAYLIVDTGDSSESVSIGTGISGTAITIGHATSETTVSDNLTVTGDLTVNGDTAAFSSANAKDPLIEIENTKSDDADGPRIRLIKNRGAAGQDDDEAGEIQFHSYNDAGTPELIGYARIKSKIVDATDGAEGGQLSLQVASHNGTMTTGVKLIDGDAAGEVDVEIGGGAASLTEIQGSLRLKDDKTLIFGGNDDATFEYDEDGTDRLLYAGAGLRISDDVKLEFGTGGDATIEYDEDGNDVLSISGAATKFTVAGVEIENASDAGAAALTLDNDDVDQIALDIDAANTTGNVIDIDAGALTTGKVINIGGTVLGKNPIVIDHNYSDTSNATITCIDIDFDKTGASSGANTITGIKLDMDNTTMTGGTNVMKGLVVTPTLVNDSGSGAATVMGMDITATGGTQGNATIARGLNISATGADYNQGIHITSDATGDGFNHLKLISGADANDHCTIKVADNGETSIITTDGGAAAAHLNLTADGNITLDAEADIIFDAKGNDFNFKANGTEVLRITSNSQDVVIKPTVQEKDIIFQNSDNEECARIVDASADGGDTAVISNTIGLAPGFGFNKPSLLISAASGDTAVTLTQEISGYLILLSPENNSITVTLPAITSDALVGIHYEFILIAPLASGKTVTIKTAGAGSDNNDNFFLHHVTTAGARTFDGDGDTLTIPATTVAGAIIECTALTSDYDPSSAATLEEVWLAKSIANTVITCTDT